MTALYAIDEQHLRRLAERLHALGPSPMLHALREVEAGADLLTTLERYAALPASFVRGLGGDRFPDPLCLVSGGKS